MHILHIFLALYENFNKVQSITEHSAIFITLETGFYAGFSNRFHCIRLWSESTRIFWNILMLYYNMLSDTKINFKNSITERIVNLRYGKYIIQDFQADQSLTEPHSSLILHILGVIISFDMDTLLSVGGKKYQTTPKTANLSACKMHNPFTERQFKDSLSLYLR